MEEISLYWEYLTEKLQSTAIETDAEEDYNLAMLPKLEIYQEFATSLPQVLAELQAEDYPLPDYLGMPSFLVHFQLKDDMGYVLSAAGISRMEPLRESTKLKPKEFKFYEEPEEKRARTEVDDYLLPMMFPRPKPLNLLAVGCKSWNMILRKLTYQEITRMEETCRTMRDYIATSNIKGELKAYELHYNSITGLTVSFDKKTKSKYTLIEISYKTNARIHARVLRIDDDLTSATLQRIKRLLQENQARADKVFLGKILEPAPALISGPELAELVTTIGAKRLFVNCRLQREDVRRPEIKSLEALSIVQPVHFGLDGFVLRQIPCPTLRIAWNDVTADTLTSLLEQWKNGSRCIKCLTVDQPFKPEDVLVSDDTNLEAEPVWTTYVQDERCKQLLSIGGWESSSNINIQIYILTRSTPEKRTVNDYLLLFFGRCRFIAATLDGIVDEKVIDALNEL